MKKFTFLMCAVLACLLNANAQEPQFVSKEQQNRNVLIEEFTGRDCPYCPLGQVGVNEVTVQYPGRVFSVNIHAKSGLSPVSYPNLNTQYGYELTMAMAYDSGLPAAFANRAQSETFHPGSAMTGIETDKQLSQAAEVNIAGQVRIDHETRVATIDVEAYYTSNSASDKNYLTILMLQDSILGSQKGAVEFNPDQMIGDKYVHMHTLRDIITDTWGDEIAPTTAGSLIIKTYEYHIPETVGEPNGVEVDLDNIHFVAFVTEKKDGTVSQPVLNVNELHTLKVKDQDFYPYLGAFDIKVKPSCSNLKPIVLQFINGGNKEITSLKYEMTVQDVTTQYSWEGALSSYSDITIEEELELSAGNQKVTLNIVEVNGSAYEYSETRTLFSDDWTGVYFPEDEDEFKIDIVQDKQGNQITWELIDSDNNVLASGGPYAALVGNGIKMHRTKVKVANNSCVKFIIYDEGGDGINCGFGEGYYKISDSKGNVIIESDGKFADMAYHNISTHEGNVSVDEMAKETYHIYPNPVNDLLTIVGNNIKQVDVYNTMGQLLKSVVCEDSMVNINVEDLQNGMYIVNVIDNNDVVSSRKISVF